MQGISGACEIWEAMEIIGIVGYKGWGENEEYGASVASIRFGSPGYTPLDMTCRLGRWGRIRKI